MSDLEGEGGAEPLRPPMRMGYRKDRELDRQFGKRGESRAFRLQPVQCCCRDFMIFISRIESSFRTRFVIRTQSFELILKGNRISTARVLEKFEENRAEEVALKSWFR